LLFCSTLLKHGRHFDYWNQRLNTCKCVCYLDFHEAGLCCYLVIHVENLLHLLQLFYFHLWPICWLPRTYTYLRTYIQTHTHAVRIFRRGRSQ
jgi:hypothetical protein